MHLSKIRTHFWLQIINILWCDSCILHGFTKHFPGGRRALATCPYDQPFLQCSFNVWIAPKMCLFSQGFDQFLEEEIFLCACSFLAYMHTCVRVGGVLDDLQRQEESLTFTIYWHTAQLQLNNLTVHFLLTAHHPSHCNQLHPHWVVIQLAHKIRAKCTGHKLTVSDACQLQWVHRL